MNLRCSNLLSDGWIAVFLCVVLWLSLTAVTLCGQEDDAELAQEHWAFQPIRETSPPDVEDDNWPLSDADRFIRADLDANGLRPVKDADRYTWLRRVSFDLTGLPPTVDEIRDFEMDESARAHERVVDRLLESRAFGERWARHWLDLVGYADQIGTSNSVFAEHAWRYRDYVIDTYNKDKPFDRFIREQIAGDLLPHASVAERAANLVATGFLVLGDIEIVEADKAKLLVDIVDRQLHKVGKAFLGMTLDCARCHDHKFDPISQHDYYAMGGFFHGTSSIHKTDRGVWSDVNVVELPETDAQRAERQAKSDAHRERLATLKAERTHANTRMEEVVEAIKKLTDANGNEAVLVARKTLQSVRNDLDGRIKQLNQQIIHAGFFAPTAPKTYGVYDVDEPDDMKITIRGNPRALGEQVPRGFLRVASDCQPQIARRQSGRLQFASWVADPENPLTARVAVNRIWQKLFGEGLVRSVDYFGLPGESPSHPELLDFLARQFVQEGWSPKRLIRSLVLSRTYRLDSSHDALAHEIDPENRLFWRMNRFRLDAEALRDAMLVVSGQLRPSFGGPALPLEYPQNVGNLDPKDVNPPSFRLEKWRPGQEFERTIYLPVIRDGAQKGPAELRNVFDFPQPSEYAGQRAITAVPTQALFLMNSPIVKGHAATLAARLSKEAVVDDKRIQLLWRKLLNRPITAVEQSETVEFLAQAGHDGWTELCHALLVSNEFLMRL